MSKLMADDADIGHPRSAFREDGIVPTLLLMIKTRPVRPIEAAARGLHSLAGIKEDDAIKVFESFLAVTGIELVEHFGQKGGFAGLTGAGALRIVGPLLAHFHPIEKLAFEFQGT